MPLLLARSNKSNSQRDATLSDLFKSPIVSISLVLYFCHINLDTTGGLQIGFGQKVNKQFIAKTKRLNHGSLETKGAGVIRSHRQQQTRGGGGVQDWLYHIGLHMQHGDKVSDSSTSVLFLTHSRVHILNTKLCASPA